MSKPVPVIRLDYLLQMAEAVVENKELESILGVPVSKYVGLVVKDGRFHFHQVTPIGEEDKTFSEEEKHRAQEIVTEIVKANMPGTEGLPGLK